MPEYMIKQEDIMVMFRALVPQSNQAINQAELDDLEKRILAVIKKNPKLSQKKIAGLVEERHSIVKYNMGKMKEKGFPFFLHSTVSTKRQYL